MSFGKHLQSLRERVGLSQSGLAEKSGISVKTLQNWEIDRALPRANAFAKLAKALGIDIGELMVGLAPPSAKKPRKGRKKK